MYFHTHCFDGIASAVLVIDALAWRDPDLHPVGYDERATWCDKQLKQPAAVVDFLFHPATTFWADHHPTTFVTAEAAAHYGARRGERWFHEPSMDSCAGVLIANFPALQHRSQLVHWANKIDAARYESVDEALFGDSPALVISKGLAVASDQDCADLVRRLCVRPLEAVAGDSDARARFEQVQRGTEDALRRFDQHALLQPDGIVVADLSGEPVAGPRYAPYHRYPNAKYSIVLYNADDGPKITAMRNPWQEFQSVPLGEIFRRYGGGGHRRVASVLISPERSRDASTTLMSIVADIQHAMRVTA